MALPVISDKPPFGTPPHPSQTPKPSVRGFGQQEDLGVNWRIKFADADGLPLNMLSFDVIDFGAIAYKEIFQNVKTILATPLFSAALERLLGVDQTIVDLPIDQAAQATIAIIDALYFWEPRAQIINVHFASDVISGRLVCNLQLNIRNVIFGTDTPYDRNNVFDMSPEVSQNLPPMPEVPPVTKPIPGPKGERGSVWFIDIVDPDASTKIVDPLVMDVFLNTMSGDVFQYLFSADDTRKLQWRKLSP